MIETAYLWDAPLEERDGLVPMLRVMLRSPGMSPQEAVLRLLDAYPEPRKRWTLADHPPNDDKTPFNYSVEFGGDLYDEYGLLDPAHKLRAWFEQSCMWLRGYGWPAPELMPVDWEGYPFDVDYSKSNEVEEHARARAAAIRYCIVEPAQRVWGVRIPAGNYEDRGWPGDSDVNAKPFPRPVVGVNSHPVFYGEPWRRFAADELKRDMAVGLERGRELGRRVIPWLDGARPDLLAYAETVGVQQVLLWGNTENCQRWLMEQWSAA